MIFVSVGMHHQGFDRLIRAMDDLDTSLGEPVVMQIGASSYEPRNARYFRFAGNDEVESLMEAARVVVIHCGVGSIISALRHRVPLVVVPRLKRYGEHVDDHQLEVARVLSQSGRVTAVYDVERLSEAMTQATVPPGGDDHKRELVDALRQHLQELVGQQGRSVARP